MICKTLAKIHLENCVNKSLNNFNKLKKFKFKTPKKQYIVIFIGGQQICLHF